MTTIHLDFETRSTVDLKETTVDVYAEHPTTDAWCACWAVGDGSVQLWIPGAELPHDLLAHVVENATVYAHNAPFELAIWNKIMVPRYGWPPLDPKQVRCTMAMAYAMALPGSLDGAAAALGIDQRKDAKGHRRMLQMARARKVHDDGTVEWWDDEERRKELYAYCKQDVEVERELHRRMVDLPEIEWRTWHLDHEINQRGVPIDREGVEVAIRVVQLEKARLDAEMERVTGGMVKACTWVNVLTDWLRFRGVDTPGVAKADLRALLAREGLPEDVRRALELRQEAAKSSTAKLDAMLNCANDDDRVRGTHQYHGAATGRWGGRKIQPQNYPRGNLGHDDVEHAIELMVAGRIDLCRALYGDMMNVVSSCLRGFIKAAPDNELTAADFSNIEGRKLAWLAGEEWKLQAFRDFDAGTGPDLYKVAFSTSFSKPVEEVTKDERQIGKTQELACGYGGGVGAFETMASTFNLDMGLHYEAIRTSSPAWVFEKAMDAWEQRGKRSGLPKQRWLASEMVKLLWRQTHPETVQFWSDLQAAAIRAVENPGTIATAGAEGRIRFRKAGSFLFCQLPSGRCLCYAYPEVVMEPTPWGTEQPKLYYMGVNSMTRKWERMDTYGGKLAENVTQASARDILRDAMLRVSGQGGRIVMHVHDELIVEHPKGQVKLRALERSMAQVPDWAAGLPVAVEGWQGERFRKE